MTEAQIQQYRTDGYVALPDFFRSDEVQAIRADLQRLRDGGIFRNVSTDGDGRTHSQTKINLQICPLSPHSTLFRALPFCDRVVEAVRTLVGDEAVLHLDQVFLKPARHGAGTSWHQDNAYFRLADPMQGMGVWIAADEATVANGTMHVIPRMFREELKHSRDPMSDHHIRCYPPEERAVPIELPAGGVLLFNYGVPHCTKGNQTDRDRAGVAFHFLHRKAARLDSSSKPLGVIMTGADATGGEREYGVTIAGTWPAEVQRARAGTAPVPA